MIDWQRGILYLALAVVTFLLWTQWIDFSERWAKEHPVATHVAETHTKPQHTDIPDVEYNATVPGAAEELPQAPETPQKTKSGALVTVTTDVVRVTIDTLGGNLVGLALLDYPKSLEYLQDPIH